MLIPAPTVVLFDVDGTLVRTEGPSPHTRAFRAAFAKVYGGECQFAPGMHGMTDLQIFALLAGNLEPQNGRALEQALAACRAMAEFYTTRVATEDEGRYVALPGASDAVEALAAAGTTLGLLTGNVPEIARDKISSVGLSRFFRFGAFGTEGKDRSALPPIAMARAEALLGRKVDRSRVFVVGDTVRDVACALDNGCRAVAVATGHIPMDQLAAAGAELVLPDLLDVEPLLKLVSGRG